ncbi:MAG: right-handed parallel beta-helix repeat-containing protein [Verrucomicrobia bacterium]|nr:right-handed parallel beta-helix repeat-containing protein [Verrucomicrobiota bacterium]
MNSNHHRNRLRRIRRILNGICALIAGAAGAWQAPAAVIHADPHGDDQNDGSPSAPVATLERARELVRHAAPGEPRVIVLHGGFYSNVGVVFGPQDSGLIIRAARGERPVLCGGVRLTGWVRTKDGLWEAPLPPYPEPAKEDAVNGLGRWEVRMLLVDGKPRPRARYPDKGRLRHLSRFNVPWMSSTGGGWKRKPTREELSTLKCRPGDIPPDLEIRNAEITVYHMWDESCVGVAACDRSRRILRLDPPCSHPPGAFGVQEYVIWNTREGLTAPGRWRHDRVRNRIVYKPLPGEDPGRLSVWVPSRTVVLRFRGERRRPIRRIRVEGLTIACATAPLLAGGFAASRFDGAVSLENAEDCVLSDLRVRGAAGHGINGRGLLRGVRVERCLVEDCGAGGVYVGGQGAVIADNRIRRIGLNQPSAIGIYRGGRNNVVAFNEVSDTPYSAINYGGVNNVIASNLIQRCMLELHDGAAIYMFAATNCVLRGNVARDIPDTGGYGSSAYYLDERSRRCVVDRNFSLNVQRPLHMHMATNNLIRGNVFITRGDARLTFPKCRNFRLEENVLYAPGKIRIENIDAITEWTRNIFFSGAGRIERVHQRDYRRGRVELGPPQGTLAADPLFVDPEKGDWRYRAGSPARKLGLEPIDVEAVGPRW